MLRQKQFARWLLLHIGPRQFGTVSRRLDLYSSDQISLACVPKMQPICGLPVHRGRLGYTIDCNREDDCQVFVESGDFGGCCHLAWAAYLTRFIAWRWRYSRW